MNKNILICIIGVVIISVIVGIVLLVGNTNTDNVEIDVKLAQEKITNLKSTNYDYKKASSALSEKAEELKIMSSFPEFVYDFDLEKFGIDSQKISSDEGMINFSMFKTEEESYMIFKPAEGKKEALENEINAYYKDKNVLKEEVNGYTVYLNTKDNKKALEILKNEGYQTLFSGLTVVQDEMLNIVGLTKEDLSEYVITIPSFIVSSQCYMVVKPAEGKEDKVKEALDNYFTKEEQKWSTYLPAEYEIIKNRKFEKIGKYLVYIVSTDNNKVLETINEAKK